MPGDFSLWLFAFAWFLAGLVNGISGMGAAMVALPIVAGSMPAQMLIPATCLMVPVISLGCAVVYWRSCRWHSLRAMFAGALPGAVAGLGALLVMDTHTLELTAGPLMLAFSVWQFCHPRFTPHGDSWKAGSIAGFASGFVNTSTSFANPPVAIYALYAGWDQKETMGTMNVFTTIVAIATCVVHASAGLYSAEVFRYALFGAPATVLGLAVATPLVRHIDALLFRRILLLVIAAAGIVCIGRGLAGIL